MATHSDEEAFDALLQEQPERPQNGRSGQVWKPLLLAAVVLGLAAARWLGAPGPSRTEVANLRFGAKAEIEGEGALDPEEAAANDEKRQQLVVEQDLKTLLHGHVAGRSSHYQEGRGGQACLQQADSLFDDVVAASSLSKELHQEELVAFKKRFTSAMHASCKDVIDERTWHDIAGSELEKQKPLMTAAIADSINKAGLGFTAEMHDWLVHESVATFQGRLGLLPTPPDQESVFNSEPSARQANANLPVAFRAELKWPECKEAILRIHNQGHCGSCWAFGGMASLDARMCIASGGRWNSEEDILSRLQATSCAPSNYWMGHDGCQGGFPHWPMEMMAKTGIVSSSCLPYYISGEGTEHFEHQDTAPPCEKHCQGGYSDLLSDDAFSSEGAAKYNWLTRVHGDVEKIRITKEAILQDGPVAFAFKATHHFMGYKRGVFSACMGNDRANHAVYTYGWGLTPSGNGEAAIEFFEASNSWGPHWGIGGHFRIHPKCMTDVTIPGPVGRTVVSHKVGSIDKTVPRDKWNPLWPWSPPPECPFHDGCVTDMEGSGSYSDNEKCVSHKLDGKRIKVKEFDTEMGYDVVTINGIMFAGKEGAGLDLRTLNSLTVNKEGIEFESDFSQGKSGFKLCEA